ncbi:MAG: ribonuclease R [Kosmotogaceae bacterium]
MKINKNDIKKFLKKHNNKPPIFKEICKEFDIKDNKQRKQLRKILKEMVYAGEVFKSSKARYSLPGDNVAVGIIQFTRKGTGAYVRLDSGGEVFIPAEQTGFALHKDRVLAEITNRKKELPEGRIAKIIKRESKKIVGTFTTRGVFAFVIPDDPKIKYDFYVSPEDFNGAKPNEKVLLKVTSYPSPGRNPEGVIERVLGDVEDPSIDLPVVIYKHGLPEPGEFPKNIVSQAKKAAVEPSKNELSERKDYRNDIVYTIDGEDAKDFDDAVAVKKIGNGHFKLDVHIADVSHYVESNTSLDNEAYERGTSVYLLDTVIPMLPFELSNNICSLKEGKNRLTMSVEMEIDEKGNIVKKEINKGVISSVKRLTYKEVNSLYEGNTDAKLMKKLDPVKKSLHTAKELKDILRENRKERGSVMNITSREVEIVKDESGRVKDILPIYRGDSEIVIEEFMIKANEAIAEIFDTKKIPFVYRVHDEPDPDSVLQFKNYLKALNLDVKIPSNINPHVMQRILEKTKDHPLHTSIERLLVRSMQRAIYSDQNIGHFGLASNAYTHFTSPIRRYPDLMVHRLLKDYILNGNPDRETRDKYKDILPKITDHCSRRERVANEAEWDLRDMKKIEYMSYRIGETFNTVITDVTKFGLFVEIPEKTINGLVHISTMDDYYEYNEDSNVLVGKHKKKVYRVGDELKVRVVRADKTTMEIDFVIENQNKGRSKKRKRRK